MDIISCVLHSDGTIVLHFCSLLGFFLLLSERVRCGFNGGESLGLSKQGWSAACSASKRTATHPH